jgi:hypothetical protein
MIYRHTGRQRATTDREVQRDTEKVPAKKRERHTQKDIKRGVQSHTQMKAHTKPYTQMHRGTYILGGKDPYMHRFVYTNTKTHINAHTDRRMHITNI